LKKNTTFVLSIHIHFNSAECHCRGYSNLRWTQNTLRTAAIADSSAGSIPRPDLAKWEMQYNHLVLVDIWHAFPWVQSVGLSTPIFLRTFWSYGRTSGVASRKVGGGPKCLILGEKHYFVWDTASKTTKWLYVPKIFGVWPPWSPWLRHGPNHRRWEQVRNQGGEAPLENFSPPVEKCVGYNLKILDIVQKIWAPLRKFLAPPGVPSWLRAWLRALDAYKKLLCIQGFTNFKSAHFVSNCHTVNSSLSSHLCLFLIAIFESLSSRPTQDSWPWVTIGTKTDLETDSFAILWPRYDEGHEKFRLFY